MYKYRCDGAVVVLVSDIFMLMLMLEELKEEKRNYHSLLQSNKNRKKHYSLGLPQMIKSIMPKPIRESYLHGIEIP